MNKGFSSFEWIIWLGIVAILSGVVISTVNKERNNAGEKNNYKIKTNQGIYYVNSYRKEDDGVCVYIPEKDIRYCGEWSAIRLNNKE